jgi:hypothetical protein
VTVAENAEAPCPACGRLNPPERRFCAKCGHRLLADAAASRARSVAPAARSGSWWSRLFDNRDRTARREYRRSLPAFYRWRRVLVVLGLVGGLVAGLAVAGSDPLGFVVDRYHDVRNTLVPVAVTATAIEPPDATAPKSDPAALTDGTEAAWTMRWEPAGEVGSCGGAPGTGVIVLTVAPTRVRALAVQAGLLESNGRRPLQALPLKLGVTFDGAPCQALQLEDDANEQVLKIDSTVPVSTIRIGVDAAKPQREDGEPVLSFTEIGVRARPT